MPMCDTCYHEKRRALGDSDGLPPWLVALLVAVVVALMIGLAGCEVAPTAPTVAEAQVGYWHSDGAQPRCTDKLCFHVYADVEVRADGSCDYHYAVEADDQWATAEAVECEAEPGDNAIQIFSRAEISTTNLRYEEDGFNFTLTAAGPTMETHWDVVLWNGIELVRRVD
jgi:hypothetical protein